jgi:hypothetical protein
MHQALSKFPFAVMTQTQRLLSNIFRSSDLSSQGAQALNTAFPVKSHYLTTLGRSLFHAPTKLHFDYLPGTTTIQPMYCPTDPRGFSLLHQATSPHFQVGITQQYKNKTLSLVADTKKRFGFMADLNIGPGHSANSGTVTFASQGSAIPNTLSNPIQMPPANELVLAAGTIGTLACVATMFSYTPRRLVYLANYETNDLLRQFENDGRPPDRFRWIYLTPYFFITPDLIEKIAGTGDRPLSLEQACYCLVYHKNRLLTWCTRILQTTISIVLVQQVLYPWYAVLRKTIVPLFPRPEIAAFSFLVCMWLASGRITGWIITSGINEMHECNAQIWMPSAIQFYSAVENLKAFSALPKKR